MLTYIFNANFLFSGLNTQWYLWGDAHTITDCYTVCCLHVCGWGDGPYSEYISNVLCKRLIFLNAIFCDLLILNLFNCFYHLRYLVFGNIMVAHPFYNVYYGINTNCYYLFRRGLIVNENIIMYVFILKFNAQCVR